jgi:asparaginyl-tRNA synthetase
MVTNYPAAVKAFYMEPDPDDARLSLSCDCLAPEGYGEIIGGGQRMASLELLTQRIDEHRCRRKPSSGTRTCAATDPCRTPASASASSARSPGSRGSITCAETIPFPRMLYRLRP